MRPCGALHSKAQACREQQGSDQHEQPSAATGTWKDIPVVAAAAAAACKRTSWRRGSGDPQTCCQNGPRYAATAARQPATRSPSDLRAEQSCRALGAVQTSMRSNGSRCDSRAAALKLSCSRAATRDCSHSGWLSHAADQSLVRAGQHEQARPARCVAAAGGQLLRRRCTAPGAWLGALSVNRGCLEAAGLWVGPVVGGHRVA